uniref:SYD n=1 Tax=Arundo donax TaxID=35708 RepID=A0A0A9FSX3_ARUDO
MTELCTERTLTAPIAPRFSSTLVIRSF